MLSHEPTKEDSVLHMAHWPIVWSRLRIDSQQNGVQENVVVGENGA